MKPFNPFDIDLEKTTLIEASAGTGKTYTITTLYCRLAALGYPVESILTVTFTEAAAAELKLRIRSRLFNTLSGLSKKDADSEDDLIRFFRTRKDSALICQRLQLALNSFDQTSIMTIHSFCMKILKENAFESNCLFDIELVPDRSMFLKQVGFDFFIQYVNNLDSAFLSYLNKKKFTPEKLIASFDSVVSRPELVQKPEAEEFDNKVFEQYRQAMEKIHDILLKRQKEIIDLICTHKGLDKRSYSKKNVPAWLESSYQKLEQNGPDTVFNMTEKGDGIYKFTKTRMALKTKQGFMLPEHEFFDLCELLLVFDEKFKDYLINLKIEFFHFFKKALEKMKEKQGKCFFDDLVNDLAKALEKDDEQNLQKAVKQTYKACLIDEFQDTDPGQYYIFSKLFAFPGTAFFMIGDPKQAIYAFRGGDIFAYLKASQKCDQKFTLEKNYRSAPLLVNGINRLFLNQNNVFIFDLIKFSKVSAPETSYDTLMEHGQCIPPLQFCFIQRDEQPVDKQGFITKETALKIIPNVVAEDILSLIQSDMQLLDKKTSNWSGITPKDIAVLVRTNNQASQIQQALSNLDIPCYLSKTGSVFESSQAIDLHDILWAVYNPDHKGFIKAALCTSVFHFTSDMISELDDQEELFFKWQDQFRRYKQIWDTKGFVSMAMELLHCPEAFLKTNSTLDERELTNFYHLIELISQACLKQQLSAYYLLKWYARQLSRDLRDESADELRLESDKQAVAIVTIHKSKGLEYPIVYLPYLWEGQRSSKQEDIVFHDPELDYNLVIDFGSNDINASQLCFEKEEQAEQRRLLYVALTRASSMCKIVWGGFKSVQTSALGAILHNNDCNDDPLMLEPPNKPLVVDEQAPCKDDQLMLEQLEHLQSMADKSILVQPYKLKSSNVFADTTNSLQTVLTARQRRRNINPAWKITSFSAISQSAHQKELTDQEKKTFTDASPRITLEQFPKGPGSGDFFHSLFESIDFTAQADDIHALVQSKSDLFGFFDPQIKQAGEKAVKQVLETRLLPGFRLKDIHLEQRLTEMEFLFSFRFFQISTIVKTLEQSDYGTKMSRYIKKLSQLTAQPFKGFLKGFIDLVIQHEGKWYVIDYKSNYLGDTYDQYSQDAMFEAMSDHHYFLQYYLYLVALHRYLENRLKDYDYNTHFGGVLYLFIRGMHPKFDSQYGVFYDRPAKNSVIYLSEKLQGK